MKGFGSLLAKWLALRGRALVVRVLWAVQAAAVLAGAATLLLAGLYASHLFLGSPETLDWLPWLEGPVWATVVGLGLRLAVVWILFDAARAGRRRLSRPPVRKGS